MLTVGLLPGGKMNHYRHEFLRLLNESSGSAFTDDPDSLVYLENLVIATAFAMIAHLADAVIYESLPGTAHDSLSSWAERLGITVRPGDKAEDIRAACEAKYRMASGATLQAVTEALQALLRDGFLQIRFFFGDNIADEPHPTYYANSDDMTPLTGTIAEKLDIDAPQDAKGAWFSARYHILVEALAPSGMSFDRFLHLMNVQMPLMMHEFLPVFFTIDWNWGEYNGFEIDRSYLGYHAL